ncbi:MAG: class I SAM-dependent methyltransferase [Cyclobacteriaceae bacterium]|nr:class I SAM-dependent methyltransferase [Cyclobacteriaceae bacterium]
MHDWKTIQLTRDYLDGVRGGIPLAATQIELIIRLVRAWRPDLRTFVDLGCGDGILGRQLFGYWPESKGIFIDYSEPMMQAAREKGKDIVSVTEYYLLDYREKTWRNSLSHALPVDVVISGFSIHHLEDDQKYRVYQDIFEILRPGGIFLNLEHVASRDQYIEKVFDEVFTDGLYEYHQNHNASITRQEIMDKYYKREDKILNKLTLVEIQCDWLREIGFLHVDCFFKLFELALFGGVRP